MSIEYVHFFSACHDESKHLRLDCLRRFLVNISGVPIELKIERAMEMRR